MITLSMARPADAPAILGVACFLSLFAPGIVAAQQARAGAGESRSAIAHVRGAVYDSIARAPVARALVQFVAIDEPDAGRTFSAESDASGRYDIRDLAPGRYIAGFAAAALDSLGIEAGERLVQVRAGEQRVNLATPSAATVAGLICGAPTGDDTGLLIGYVRDTESEESRTGAAVLVEWSETLIDATGVRQRVAGTTVETNGTGWFAICQLPADVVLNARARHGTDSSGFVEVEIPPNELRSITFHVGGATAVEVEEEPAEVDSVPLSGATTLRGRARLTGTVRDARGNPVAGATVMVWGSDRESVTAESGRYVLDSLPGGTHMVEARTIGYVPLRSIVQLAEHRPAVADFVFDRQAAMLRPVEVRADVVYSRQLVEFERRRRAGWGKFVTQAEIGRFPNAALHAHLRQIPGVVIRRNTAVGPATIRMRFANGSLCVPDLYIDGVRQPMDETSDIEHLYSERLAAIEVYSRPAIKPLEFSHSLGCGAIVVWTRQPPKPQKN